MSLTDWILRIGSTGVTLAVASWITFTLILVLFEGRYKLNKRRKEEFQPINIPTPLIEGEKESKLIHIGRDKYPVTLLEYIGHSSVTNTLKKLVYNYHTHGRVIGHILFSGHGGLGKTTLSEILANEIGRGYLPVIGKQLTTINKVKSYLNHLEEGSILFADELHAVEDIGILEFLYSVLQDFKLNLGTEVKHYPRFTFIGATTDPYLLPDPLLQRLVNKFKLDTYSEEEIIKIIEQCPTEIDQITDKAKLLIARTCQGNVRLARNEILGSCIEETIYQGKDQIDGFIVRGVLEEKGINPNNGLNKLQLKVIETLKEGNVMGLGNLAGTIGISAKELEVLIEPYLLKQGYVQRTPRGRVITSKGLEL